MSGHLHVSWEEYHRLIERLVLVLDNSGWSFDMVMGLSRGGLRVADVISRVMNKPFAVLAASSYNGREGMLQGELTLSADIATTAPVLGPKVLVVDDLADTGHTLAAVVPHLLSHYPHISEVRTAVLWLKGVSSVVPDYSVQHLPDSPWIHQPFEAYDTMSIDTLKERVRLV